MPRVLEFTKYQGLGNDFLVVDARDGLRLTPAAVRRLCDRHFGVGADGVLTLLPARREGADLWMRVQNADGSEPETCGNGLRCAARWTFEHVAALRERPVLRMETLAGVVGCERVGEGIRVSMGAPRLEASQVPVATPLPTRGPVREVQLEAEGRVLTVSAVSMGNPHLVIHAGADAAEAEQLGPLLERHPAFPEGVNVGFARPAEDGGLDLVVWERGAGLTLACGTGACAAVVAGVAAGRLPAGVAVPVRLPGGALTVEVPPDFSEVYMTGPAEAVYQGQVPLLEGEEEPA